MGVNTASAPHPPSAVPKGHSLRPIRVAPGRVLQATPVFDTYWRFAAARQDLFMRRVRGDQPPWTDDPVLSRFRFTNAYRASDRVSQYLIRTVLYEGPQTVAEICFRTLLFKVFNRIDTWESLTSELGPPRLSTFNVDRCARVLDRLMARGERVYSAAYIMPSPQFGCARKHRNHLRMLAHLVEEGAPNRIGAARSLEEVFSVLRSYKSLGDFLAFQFTIDLNYSAAVNFSEMDFVVAGPGARSGIQKCFADTAGLSDADVIRAVAERAPQEFARQSLAFQDLWGRPLQLIDCQNLFCEVDKYARVMHPEYTGASGRTRIKQTYVPRLSPLPQWYPPKWKLEVPRDACTADTARPEATLRPLGVGHNGLPRTGRAIAV